MCEIGSPKHLVELVQVVGRQAVQENLPHLFPGLAIDRDLAEPVLLVLDLADPR
jgi:hypothetical protein